VETQISARTEKILIVDDEPVVRDSLGKWLNEEGFNVKAVASANQGCRSSRYQNAGD
jgi:DNA-binding NtrC family response regulator